MVKEGGEFSKKEFESDLSDSEYDVKKKEKVVKSV